MKRKLVALLVNPLIDVLLGAFSLVFRLKDNSPGIHVTNIRGLAEALIREGPFETPPIRPAEMPGADRPSVRAPKSFAGRSGPAPRATRPQSSPYNA